MKEEEEEDEEEEEEVKERRQEQSYQNTISLHFNTYIQQEKQRFIQKFWSRGEQSKARVWGLYFLQMLNNIIMHY